MFTILNWTAIGLMIWKTDPDNVKDFIIPGSYLPMGLLLFGGIFWILSILTLSAVRAMRWTAGIMIFIYLRIMGLGTIINGILILGLLTIWEIYTYRKKPKENVLHSD